MRHPSDSKPQTKAERKIIEKASEALRCHLSTQTMRFRDGQVQIDGYSLRARVLCEAFSHQGVPVGGQLRKPLADALKLLFVEKQLKGRWRKVLAFADKEAARPFQKASWRAGALRSLGIKVVVVKLTPRDRARLVRAQRTQTMVNPRRT